jgi:hypothetical protein
MTYIVLLPIRSLVTVQVGYDKPISPITSSDSCHRPQGKAMLDEIETQQDPTSPNNCHFEQVAF